MEMTRVRSNMRRNITVPVEFKLNGVTPEDQHERDHKVRVGFGTGPCVGKVPLCQHSGFAWRRGHADVILKRTRRLLRGQQFSFY